MNILFAMPWDQTEGGVTHVAASLARSLEERGHRAFFVFPAENWRLREGTSKRGFHALECRFRDYPSEKGGARARLSWLSTVLVTLPQLAQFARAHEIDLINVHYATGHFSLLVDLAEKLEVPLVVSAHGSDLLPDSDVYCEPGLNRLLDSASNVIVPSRAFLRSVVDAYPGVRNKSSYIYNGYDQREFDLETAPPSVAGRSQMVALCIAAHIPKKGIDVLLRAMQAMPPDLLRLRLVGDGLLRRQLEELSKSLGLSDRVAFVGTRDRHGVCEELLGCDLLVMCSRHPSESFGLAALEAMAFGKAVVASAIGGLPELVEHDATGLLVPPDDPQALALALTQLCTRPDLRKRLGEAARISSRRFTVESTADHYERLFTRLVQAHGSAIVTPASSHA